MSELIYALCFLASATCFGLLWRAWMRSRSALLFWSALCFAALSVNNLLLVADKVLTPMQETMATARLSLALVAVLLLLWGLVFEDR